MRSSLSFLTQYRGRCGGSPRSSGARGGPRGGGSRGGPRSDGFRGSAQDGGSRGVLRGCEAPLWSRDSGFRDGFGAAVLKGFNIARHMLEL